MSFDRRWAENSWRRETATRSFSCNSHRATAWAAPRGAHRRGGDACLIRSEILPWRVWGSGEVFPDPSLRMDTPAMALPNSMPALPSASRSSIKRPAPPTASTGTSRYRSARPCCGSWWRSAFAATMTARSSSSTVSSSGLGQVHRRSRAVREAATDGGDSPHLARVSRVGLPIPQAWGTGVPRGRFSGLRHGNQPRSPSSPTIEPPTPGGRSSWHGI